MCCESRVCSSWCVGALVGRLLHVCAMCTMCTFLACWWCRVCSSSQHPQQTQHAKCVGGKATTHAPAYRGAQLYSQFSSNNHRGDSRGVASVVSLVTTRTHAQHAAAAATAAAAERTARGEYVCGYCQRVFSGEERARWLRQLFSVACNASPHLSSGGGILRYPIPKWLLFLNNVGSGFHCLRSLFFFLFLRKGLGLMPDPFQGTIV